MDHVIKHPLRQLSRAPQHIKSEINTPSTFYRPLGIKSDILQLPTSPRRSSRNFIYFIILEEEEEKEEEEDNLNIS